MDKKTPNFSMSDAMRLANSDAGQELIRLLQSTGGDQLRSIMELASSGHMEQAANSLTSLLSSDAAQALVRQLGGSTDE